jgi:uncharacterized protein
MPVNAILQLLARAVAKARRPNLLDVQPVEVMRESMLSIPAASELAVVLVSAIQRGDVDALQAQLRQHPELAAARVIDGRGVSRTLLHVAADWPGHFPNGAATVAILAAAGADVNATAVNPKSAESALHWAASSDDVAVLDALLDAGADIEVPGAVFTGGTPMSDAVVFGQWRAARRLLERGATTTIWQAAALGLVDRVRALCSTEPPPTREQITNALWHACHGAQQATAEFLLDQGADVNWIGYDHKTPYDLALGSRGNNLLNRLRARGARSASEPG